MENFAPLVSVITPFLNTEEFLKETIESVIRQEYTNWELILIDDGSFDGSTDIAKEFAEKYPDKIFYLEHEGHVNKAAAASRNLGVNNAKGEIAAFLDADDLWLPKYLKLQVDILQNNPQISMLCEATRYWYSWSNSKTEDIVVMVGAEEPDRLYHPPQLVKRLYPLGKGAAPCPSSILIKMSALRAIKGFEESFIGKYQVYEDQAFLIKIYLNETVYISSYCNNFYRQRIGSVMNTTSEQGDFFEARYFFLKWLDNYLQKEQIKAADVQKLLRKAFYPYKYSLIHKMTKKILFGWGLLIKKFTQ